MSSQPKAPTEAEAPIATLIAERGAYAELLGPSLPTGSAGGATTVAVRLWCRLPAQAGARPAPQAIEAAGRDLQRLAGALAASPERPIVPVVGDFLPAVYPARDAPGRMEVCLGVVFRAPGRHPALAATVRARMGALGLPERT